MNCNEGINTDTKLSHLCRVVPFVGTLAGACLCPLLAFGIAMDNPSPGIKADRSGVMWLLFAMMLFWFSIPHSWRMLCASFEKMGRAG